MLRAISRRFGNPGFIGFPYEGPSMSLHNCLSVQSVPSIEAETPCGHGLFDKATYITDDMYLSILKTCIRKKCLSTARKIHAHMNRHRQEIRCLLAENVVLALERCGGLDDASNLFHELEYRTVFSWTAMISGFVDRGLYYQAVDMYHCMLLEGVSPDHITYINILKACGCTTDLNIGRELHANAEIDGFASNVYVGNTLISMYGKCGTIFDAEHMFFLLNQRSTASWTAMISAYVENEICDKGLLLYRQMVADGVNPNNQTFVCITQACGILAGMYNGSFTERGSTKAMCLDILQAIHLDTWRAGFSSDIYLVTTLIKAYSKCDCLEMAEAVFGQHFRHNVETWTCMLSAYIEQREGKNALLLYRQMVKSNLTPNDHTLVCVLQACDVLAEEKSNVYEDWKTKKIMSFGIIQAIHVDVRRRDSCLSSFLCNTLLKMYGKYGTIGEAENVFESLPQVTVVSWTIMIIAYIQHGYIENALKSYRKMHVEGIYPNEQTLVAALQACGHLGEREAMCVMQGKPIKAISLKICQALHLDAQRTGLSSDPFVCATLLSTYGKCGALYQAEEVFYKLSSHDTVIWNALLSACIDQGQGERALNLYEAMQSKHVSLDHITVILLLQASSEEVNFEICKQLHFSTFCHGLEINLPIASSVLHAYGKCGSISDADAVYCMVPQPDVVFLNARISGYAWQGNCDSSLYIFEEMLLAGLKPDAISFAPLLSASNHAGFVSKSIKYLQHMSIDYGIIPDYKHMISIVDLLGRAGDTKRLENIFCQLPMQTELPLWLYSWWHGFKGATKHNVLKNGRTENNYMSV